MSQHVLPCPFCGSDPTYSDSIGYQSYTGCIAWGWIRCPTCRSSFGDSEIIKSIHWKNQEILDQLPGIQLKYERGTCGKGHLEGEFCRMDGTAARAIKPVLREAVIALWNTRITGE